MLMTVFGRFVNAVRLRLDQFTVGWTWVTKFTGYTVDRKLILLRKIYTDQSTIGDLTLDGQFQCYTLELSCRKMDGKKTCIPEGVYEIAMEWSARFKMNTPHLLNVPGRTFIEIHPGNKPSDTEGCILLGKSKDADWVGSSRLAYQELIPKLENKLALGKLYIEVSGC